MPELIKNICKVFYTAKLLLRQKLNPDPASCHFLCCSADFEDFMQETCCKRDPNANPPCQSGR